MLTFSDSPVEWLLTGNEMNVVSWQLRDFCMLGNSVDVGWSAVSPLGDIKSVLN